MLSAPLVVLVPAFSSRPGLSMAWNGLSLPPRPRSPDAAAAARRWDPAERARRGGQNRAAGFAAVVAASSWRVGFAVAAVFPLAGVLLLRPLRA